MELGDLVQTVTRPEGWPGQETIFLSLTGIVVKDHSPMRPRDVGRVVDVLWSNGAFRNGKLGPACTSCA